MANLEEEIGTKLFEKNGRRIRLTNEGILLRRRAEEILALVDKTEMELLTHSEQMEGTIVIGMGELASVQNIIELCAGFQERYPDVQFEFYTATADQVKERIEAGLVDLGLLLEPVDMEAFEFIRLRESER